MRLVLGCIPCLVSVFLGSSVGIAHDPAECKDITAIKDDIDPIILDILSFADTICMFRSSTADCPTRLTALQNTRDTLLMPAVNSLVSECHF